MAGEKAILKTLTDGAISDRLAGASFERIIERLVKNSKVSLDAGEIRARLAPLGRVPMPLPPKHLLKSAGEMHPTDLAETIERGGARLRAQLENTAQDFPGVKKGMTTKKLAEAIGDPSARTIQARVLSRAAVKTDFLKWLDLDSSGARELFRRAVEGMKDAALAARLDSIARRTPLRGDLETYVTLVANGLPKSDAGKLVRAVHAEICHAIANGLEGTLKTSSLAPAVKAALGQSLNETSNEIAPLFRNRLRALLGDTEGGAQLSVIVAGLDGSARELALKQFFGSISERAARSLLDAHYDTEGLRRLLANIASFRKMYSASRRVRAMENLIGWMYESSKFVADLVVGSTRMFQQTLTVALNKGLNVTVGRPYHHFDVKAPTVLGAKERQATDLLGTVPLSGGPGGHRMTVHVIAEALEAKGESGVRAGIEQLVNLRKRFANGNLVKTEHGTFTMGKDLFLSVEEALLALKVPAAASKRIAADLDRAGLGTFSATVVSPLPEAEVIARYGALLKARRVRYVAHPISRAEIVPAAEGLAPHFELLIRQYTPES